MRPLVQLLFKQVGMTALEIKEFRWLRHEEVRTLAEQFHEIFDCQLQHKRIWSYIEHFLSEATVKVERSLKGCSHLSD